MITNPYQYQEQYQANASGGIITLLDMTHQKMRLNVITLTETEMMLQTGVRSRRTLESMLYPHQLMNMTWNMTQVMIIIKAKEIYNYGKY